MSITRTASGMLLNVSSAFEKSRIVCTTAGSWICAAFSAIAWRAAYNTTSIPATVTPAAITPADSAVKRAWRRTSSDRPARKSRKKRVEDARNT